MQLSKPNCELPLVAAIARQLSEPNCELPLVAAVLALFKLWERSNCLDHCLRFPGSVIAFLRQELPLRVGPLPAPSRFSDPAFLRPQLPSSSGLRCFLEDRKRPIQNFAIVLPFRATKFRGGLPSSARSCLPPPGAATAILAFAPPPSYLEQPSALPRGPRKRDPNFFESLVLQDSHEFPHLHPSNVQPRSTRPVC